MAHGDYDCCAICDSKQSYGGWDAKTKEKICSYCVCELSKEGVVVHDVNELLAWMDETDINAMREILIRVNFRKCFYPNEVDDLLLDKGIRFNSDSTIKGKK